MNNQARDTYALKLLQKSRCCGNGSKRGQSDMLACCSTNDPTRQESLKSQLRRHISWDEKPHGARKDDPEHAKQASDCACYLVL